MVFRKQATTPTRWFDTLVAVALLGVAAYFLHFRSNSDSFGMADAFTTAMLLGGAFVVGWRDRVPMIISGASRLLGKSKGDGSSDGA